jgi:two-component SAPR family response regulator
MRVLHLEDDGPLREILAAAMIAVAPDCQLRQFKSSDNALMYASKHGKSVDLFIVDIRVPGDMNGLEFAQKVRELNCPGVIVITSAYSPPEESLLEEIKGKWYPKPWHIFETTQKLFDRNIFRYIFRSIFNAAQACYRDRIINHARHPLIGIEYHTVRVMYGYGLSFTSKICEFALYDLSHFFAI